MDTGQQHSIGSNGIDDLFPGLQLEAVTKLLLAGEFGRLVAILPLRGGANNRVYRVNTDRGPALVKAYFQHVEDPRDRLASEFNFSRFAWAVGLRCLPRPIAADVESRMGLYEFVSGSPIEASQVTEELVLEAMNFFCELNGNRDLQEAALLPPASEACFSFAEHLQHVHDRLERVAELGGDTIVDRDASSFVRNRLMPAWDRVSEWVCNMSHKLGISLDEEISLAQRCLSPSDFGFHNAIMAKDGTIRFIDFEYAGWDDPAKMVSDFFSQPKIPVSMKNYDMFVKHTGRAFQDVEAHRRRCALMLPIYRIKWCCIMLNDFLPMDSQRRRFADQGLDLEKKKEKQLEKAMIALANLSGD
jgi:hypothetical protein